MAGAIGAPGAGLESQATMIEASSEIEQDPKPIDVI